MKIALTFDDGPSTWTGPILDLLAEHNAKATFFVCGHAVERQPHLLQRMLADGHEVGNHSFNHPRFTSLTTGEITGQLRRTQEIIFEHGGYTPIVWRAPYFDMNDHVIEWGEREHLRHVGATVDPADWMSDAETIVRRVLSTGFRDSAIVDLHDGIPPDGGSGTSTRQPTVDAVAQILARNTHARFVTASQINRKIEPEQVAVIVVTRGDVQLRDVLAPFEGYDFGSVWVWNNLTDDDLAVYGRYAAIDNVDEQVILVVDDDTALSRGVIESLLANYQPGLLTANMPAAHRGERYTDSCLVGFGAIFDRDLPMRAFARAESLRLDEQVFNRTCDVVFTSLTPFQLVDWPVEHLPWSYDRSRMYKQPGFGSERGEVLEACRTVREPACA